MKKIISILGARPQFVKAAVLSRIIKEKNEIEEIIVHTGQHFDQNMSQVFFDEMEIPHPKYNLGINGLSHGAMTGQMLEKIEAVLIKEKPSMVVVYGDTNSTLAGALAAKKLGIMVTHVEAGLRSFNMKMPEEVNRILTDRISDLLLCPTSVSVANLKAEGFASFKSKVIRCGDIMKDSVSYYSKMSASRSDIINELGLNDNEFVLATIHRQENTDDPEKLESIVKALNQISKDSKVLLPLHPRTRAAMERYNLSFEGIVLDPLGYFDMLELLKHCSMVITDSGGLQKEAFFNKKPCIIVREETEWVELSVHGYAKITGHNAQKMISAFDDFNISNIDFEADLYGNEVGIKIYDEIQKMIN